MHKVLKKINDKFVVEWNKYKEPNHSVPTPYDYFARMYEWQQNTKIVEFANGTEFLKVHNYLFTEKAIDSDLGDIDILDCVEIKTVWEYNTDRNIPTKDDLIYKAYFKEPVKVESGNDLLLNSFGNWCLINNIKFNDSNQIAEQVMCYLNSDYYKRLKN